MHKRKDASRFAKKLCLTIEEEGKKSEGTFSSQLFSLILSPQACSLLCHYLILNGSGSKGSHSYNEEKISVLYGTYTDQVWTYRLISIVTCV